MLAHFFKKISDEINEEDKKYEEEERLRKYTENLKKIEENYNKIINYILKESILGQYEIEIFIEKENIQKLLDEGFIIKTGFHPDCLKISW